MASVRASENNTGTQLIMDMFVSRLPVGMPRYELEKGVRLWSDQPEQRETGSGRATCGLNTSIEGG